MRTKRFTEKVQDYLFKQINSMSNDELHTVVAECHSLTTSNCGWLEYELRDIIRDLAENKLRLRQEQAKMEQQEKSQ